MKTSRRIFVIADRVWERITEVCVRDGITASELVRRAIIEFLNRDDKDNSKTKELCECVGGNNED